MSAFTISSAIALVNEHKTQSQFNNTASATYSKTPIFFEAVLESLVDGVLILTHRGKLIHTNSKASKLCQQLAADSKHPNTIPQEVWRVCQSLIEGRELFGEQPVVIESEVKTFANKPLRLRGQWLEGEVSDPHILIFIEDCQQSWKNQAIAETQKYGFTPREAQIWSLRRAQLSYKQIATKLYISENTVKKHMKNIHAKRKQANWAEQN